MKSYKIYLIRHGETDANEKGLYIGCRTDLPLSPKGLTGLLKMKSEYEYPSAKRFFTSPLSRCRQTLNVLYPNCHQEVIDGLKECDFGEWDGQNIAQLQANTEFQQWMYGSLTAIPGGEDASQFQQRVMQTFETLVNDLIHSGDTEAVICTHGGVIMLIMAAYAFPRAEMHEWVTESGGGFVLRITPTLWFREPVAEAISTIPMLPGKQS